MESTAADQQQPTNSSRPTAADQQQPTNSSRLTGWKRIEGIASPTQSQAVDLFLASFLALFLELVLIRWVPSYERVLAYFTNFVLIAAFLGLGVGGMLARRRQSWICFQPLLVLGVIILAILFNRHVKTFGANGDLFYTDLARQAKIGLMLPECLGLFFLLLAIVFVPLGQKIGQDLMSFSPPLRGYVINILGSLAGVMAFTMVSFLSLSPGWWFAVTFLGLLWFVREQRRWFALNVAASILAIFIVWQVGKNFIWTPYNKLAVRPATEQGAASDPIPLAKAPSLVRTPGFHLTVNDDYYQAALDFSPAAVLANPSLTNNMRHYEFVYGIPGLSHDDVLVVGAGTGNDTAAALRHGAKHVDAVEIDPGIYHLGVVAHPEQPYQDPRVTAIVDDARSFFNKTNRRYDIIVFGLLDTHRLFSAMSSIRLDAFVYTLESFQEARRLLKDGGVICVQHATGVPYLDIRMYRTLNTAFGMTPLMFNIPGASTFVVGPGVQRFAPASIPPNLPNVELASDDWPFFYMAGRVMPQEYRLALEAMAILSLVILMFVSGGAVRSLNFHFFFLGSAFLLIETVSVTRFAMLFGSTWVVNSIVFTAILLVVLFANLWMARIQAINLRLLYALLGGSIVLNFLFPVHALLHTGLVLRLIVAMGLMALPIFFAAFIFARSYKETSTPELAFASNLLGAVVGGLAEYSTLVLGFRVQLLIALALYGLSLVALTWRSNSAGGETANQS